MCGIAGIVSRDLDPAAAREAVERMTSALAHRGPDGSGSYLHQEDGLVVALGHRRLSIIDLSDEASQPFRLSANSSALVFNGEIYNYKALATPHVLSTTPIAARSDVAVLAASVALQWTAALPQLNGIFAFGVWDGRRRKILLARDHLGVKPLYWAQIGQTILFASEVRAILAARVFRPTVDSAALRAQLIFGSTAEPRTLIDGIRMLPAGGSLEVDDQLRITERRWWSLPRSVADLRGHATATSVQRELARATEMQMVADVPVGVFLSGGVDSTAVATLACRQGFKPKAISLFFESSPLSEETLVRETAARLGIELHASTVSADAARNSFLRWLDAQDHPSVDGFNTFLVSELAHQAGLKVVLSGIGGDEMFGGYQGFARARAAEAFTDKLRWMKPLARVAVASGLGNLNRRVSRALDMVSGKLPPYYVSRSLRGTAEVKRLTAASPSETEVLTDAALAENALIASETSAVRRLSMLESVFYLRNVLLRDADQMGMAHALEIRVPFLDPVLAAHAVAALGDSFPPVGSSKPLLVNAVADAHLTRLAHLPKRGFALPLSEWLGEPAGLSMIRSLASDIERNSSWILARSITRSVQRFAEGRETIYSTLSLLTTARWLHKFGVAA